LPQEKGSDAKESGRDLLTLRLKKKGGGRKKGGFCSAQGKKRGTAFRATGDWVYPFHIEKKGKGGEEVTGRKGRMGEKQPETGGGGSGITKRG